MAARIQSKIPEPLVISGVLLMPGDPPPLWDPSPVPISTCQQALVFSDDALGLPDVCGAGGQRCTVMQFSQRGPPSRAVSITPCPGWTTRLLMISPPKVGTLGLWLAFNLHMRHKGTSLGCASIPVSGKNQHLIKPWKVKPEVVSLYNWINKIQGAVQPS